ncbi:methyltransferase domain-containing protein, partial [candidate division WOR-3 bacterium]|nr:methyltransferase domain-containing protein [candidate division WOR-3 bacterium]
MLAEARRLSTGPGAVRVGRRLRLGRILVVSPRPLAARLQPQVVFDGLDLGLQPGDAGKQNQRNGKRQHDAGQRRNRRVSHRPNHVQRHPGGEARHPEDQVQNNATTGFHESISLVGLSTFSPYKSRPARVGCQARAGLDWRPGLSHADTVDRTAYDRFFELEARHFWRIAKRRLVLEWLARYRPARAGLRILDVGGACSLITRELGRFGSVECIEADAATVAVARERLGVNIRQGLFPGVALEGRFDVITMLDVLEHIDDDLAALRAARALLKDDGLLLLTVPALPWLWSDHDVALHHHRRYLKRELVTIVERAGFDVGRCSYYTSLLLPFLVLQRLA